MVELLNFINLLTPIETHDVIILREKNAYSLPVEPCPILSVWKSQEKCVWRWN